MSTWITWYKPNRDDFGVIIQLICCLCGVGSLSMPHIFAGAGPVFSSISFIIIVICNVYSTIALSKCFLLAPAHIQTYCDLGYYLFGKTGRIAVQSTQLSTCFLIPIAFLTLGGVTLLPTIFASTLPHVTANVWIAIMAVVLLPVVFIRMLKEAFVILILGATATILADFIATGGSYSTQSWDYFEPTKIDAVHIVNSFGAFALAYGAAVIVPTVQHHHSRPESMPSTIVLGMLLISAFYLVLGIMGYVQFGCSAPSNLLLAMGTGTLQKIAYCLMQLHIMIAFAVMINPLLFFIERHVLKRPSISEALEEGEEDDANDFVEVQTPKANEAGDDDGNIKYTTGEKMKSMMIRTSIVAVQCFIAMFAQSSFSDIADLIGASVMTACSVVLPCIFYYKMFKHEMTKMHKVLCIAILVINVILGLYSTVESLRNIVENASTYKLFSSVPSTSVVVKSEMPFCPAGYISRHSS